MSRVKKLRQRAMQATLVLVLSLPSGVFADTSDGAVARGAATFVRVGCSACHGTRGAGGGEAGPTIAPNTPPVEAVFAQLRYPARDMPAYPPSLLSDAQIRDIYAFLTSIGPGKPAADISALSH